MKRPKRNKRQEKQLKKKTIIGITGGYASGKSTVAGYFDSFGAEVINADCIAHDVLKTDKSVFEAIVSNFSSTVLKRNGAVDKKKLRAIVFGDPKLLEKLNSIMHPKIIEIIHRMISDSNKRVIVIDAPLLFEAGLENMVDWIIVVKVSCPIQLARALKTANMPKREIIGIMASQMPMGLKIRMADFVIDNSGTKANARKQAEAIWRQIGLHPASAG